MAPPVTPGQPWLLYATGGIYSSQVASSGISSWAEGVEPCPVSSEQPLHLFTQACGIDIMYNKVSFRYLCA